MRLLFWRKIVCMSQSRLVHLYSIGRAQHQAGKKSKWCKETHLLLESLGLEHIWNQDGLSEEEYKLWPATIKEKIQQREEKAWRVAMQSKPKLRTYRLLKNNLCFEEAPRPKSKGDDDAPKRRHKRTQDRERTPQSNEQRSDTTRERASMSICVWRGGRRMPFSDRLCGVRRLEREDVPNCACERSEERKSWQSKADERYHRRWSGEHVCGSGCRKAALNYCNQAMKRRNAIVVQHLDQKTRGKLGVELRPSRQ